MSNKEAYFARAQSWANDALAHSRQSARRAWTAAAVVAAIAMIEAVALALVTPLKSVEPVTLMVDRHTGYVQAISPLSPTKIEASEALTRSFLAQYVLAREEFDRATVAIDYRKVALWSAGPARTSYLSMIPAEAAGSPFRRYPPGTVVEIAIKSVSRLAPDTALVRFDSQVVGGGGRSPTQPWIAIVHYRYVAAPMRFEDRLVNPLGFQVVSYRKDAEAPATAALDSRTAEFRP